MKMALAVITKYVNDKMSLLEFLYNARRHDQIIDRLIIVYSHGCESHYVERLREIVELDLIRVNEFGEFEDRVKAMGLSHDECRKLIYSPTLESNGIVPYSKYRNIALLQALFTQMDVIFFIDTDVYPRILLGENNHMEEVDYFGTHLKYLRENNIYITTSDYSGYFIIPPMDFEHIEGFMEGIQKESALPLIKDATGHRCISHGSLGNKHVRPTDKFLGGNLAIKLSSMEHLPPFFSSTYHVGEEVVLTRGEDTIMGLCAAQSHIKALDIDFLIFHDTFGNFPHMPDIRKEKCIKDRFYYACLGWIGRNVFYNYIRGLDYKEIYEKQKELLIKTSPYAASYLNDERFRRLPEAIDTAYMNLGRMVDEYEETLHGFGKVTKTIFGGESFESAFGKPLPAGGIW
ncbi:MAG: hypothetical protein GT589_02285 [Peptoclostridium sp.]|uniref:hypothetical protein n=1 Tax=Peptoclostridium sp. TaxID=1904860 RepID=UPI00139B589A|nr:hypothetical protein [Peptoclostridium sp.]MZQ74968.1 hypothetical protein [Peptoclostridium sp.]